MHEVTHAIETQAMKNLILDYANKHEDFSQALESLKQSYGTNDVSSEVIADISGQLFGNQEFINSLVMENTPQSKNIIKKVYYSVKRLLNTLTEKGRYRKFLEDLEIKSREAYRTTTTEQAVNNLNCEIKYSFEKISNFNLKEYNNAKNIQLAKNEFAKLATLVETSDVQPGINKIENIYDYNTKTYKNYTIYKKLK